MIVTSTAEVKEAIGVNKNISWDSLSPHMKMVEDTIAVDMLGKDLYDIIEANSSLTPYQAKLRGYMQTIISAFGMYYAAPQLNMSMSDIGLTEHRSVDGSASPVQLWRFNDVRSSMFFAGDTYRDLAYKYMQDNQDEFTEWVASDSYTIYNKLFVRSNKDLHQALGKGERVGTYLTLVPFLEIAQQKYLNAILCNGLYADLLEKQKTNDTLTTYEAQAIYYAKAASAWFSLAEALPTIKVLMISGTMVTSMPAESSKVVAPISDTEKNIICQDAMNKGNLFLATLKKYLYDNVSEFPLYEESTCYQAMQSAQGKTFKVRKSAHSLGFN
jgi:hypothetical protein